MSIKGRLSRERERGGGERYTVVLFYVKDHV